jgi:hypothetical protein
MVLQIPLQFSSNQIDTDAAGKVNSSKPTIVDSAHVPISGMTVFESGFFNPDYILL